MAGVLLLSFRPIARVSGRATLLWCFGLVSPTMLLAMPTLAVGRQVASPPTNTPASDDQAFDAALPPLDTAAPPTTTPPVAAPPAAAPDPELTQTLPPIDTADTTPPAPTLAQAAAGDATVRIRYQTTVKGLAGFKTDALEGDLGRQFHALSALIKDGKNAANAAQVQARANEDVLLAVRIMKAAGYYDGIATSTIDLVPGQPGQVLVTINATPGSRYVLAKITVTGPPDPAKIAQVSLALKSGDPVDAALIEGSEANVSLRLPENGYPFAKLGDRDIALDETLHNADYILPIDPGPKAHFAGIQTSDDKVFTVSHLGIFPRYKPGQVYDSRLVEDIRQALVATSLFSTVSVEPVRTGKTNPDGSEDVDLLVRQTKGPWHSLAATAGYSTGEGATVTGSYTWRNLFPPEGALILTAIAGTQEQGGSVTFRRSDAGQRDRTFQTLLSIDRTTYSAYKANTADLSVSMSRVSTPIWQKRWTWSVGGEIVGSNEAGAALTLGGAQPRIDYLVGAIPLMLGYDRSDNLLNPTRGFRITGKLSPETSLKGGKVSPYARTQLQVTGYYPLGKSIVLAGRAEVASIIGTSIEDLAPSRRLYSGGGGSVRGYGYQELGPKDANNNPIGGRDQTEFAIEARYRFGNFGIVPFVDAGRVGEATSPSLSGLRYGAGIGGRFYTNFGPLRVDVATPINRQPGESVIALYIGIGQAF